MFLFRISYLSQEQRYGAINQQKRHDCIRDFCIFGKEQLKNRTEERPTHSGQKRRYAEQRSKEEERSPLTLIIWEYIRLHRNDAVKV